MIESKQEAIEKILAFSYMELAEWIRARLHGDDRYFPIYEGYETNLSKFLSDAFTQIKEEKFRGNFLEILEDLTSELWGYSKSKDLIKGNEEYIYELLSLCGRIKEFERKKSLYRVARSGKLKGFEAHDKDLHLMLVRALASYKVVGDFDFWINQMKDDTNKYYANAAFYALLNRQYELDFLFDYIDIFIDRFNGEIDLVLGIKALINDYSPRNIIKRFKRIEAKLTRDQKIAVNHSFEELKYGKPFKISPGPDKLLVYKPLKTAVSVAGEKPLEYETAETLQEKTGKIFQRLGAAVHFNYQMAGHTFDIFIQRKKLFTDDFECYVCRCREGQQNIGKEEIERFAGVAKDVKGCIAVFISGTGFTKGAQETAKKHGILLKNLRDLEVDVKALYVQLEEKDQKIY